MIEFDKCEVESEVIATYYELLARGDYPKEELDIARQKALERTFKPELNRMTG